MFTGPKHWKFGNNWYFFTADEPEFQELDQKTGETVGKKYDWLDARNVCRKFCMDSVSLESEQEWNMIKNNITTSEFLIRTDSS